MDNRTRLYEFHKLLCNELNKAGIKDEWHGKLLDWKVDEEDPYNTFLGGICLNDHAFNYLHENGYLYKRICPECGQFPIENKFTFSSGLNPYNIFFICENCYKKGIESNPFINKKKSGCYIATACYKDPNSYEIEILKNYRDKKLNKSILGKISIHFYYIISPPLARWLMNNKRVRACLKI